MDTDGPIRLSDWGGAFLAVGHAGQWAVATTTQVQVRDGTDLVAEAATPGAPVVGLRFTEDGRLLLAAPHRFDLSTRDWLPALASPDNRASPRGGYVLRAGAWDASGTTLLLAEEFRPGRGAPAGGAESADRVVRVDAAGRTVLAEEAASAVAFVADGRMISAGTAVTVLDPAGSPAGRVALDRGAVVTVEVRGDVAVAATRDGGVSVIDLASGGGPVIRAAWDAHDETAVGAGWLSDEALVSTGWDGAVRAWDLDGRQLAEQGPGDSAGPASPAQACGVGADGTVLVAHSGPEAGVLAYRFRR